MRSMSTSFRSLLAVVTASLAITACNNAAKVTSLVVAPATVSLAVSTTAALTATAVKSDNTKTDVTKSATWTSSAPTIATVSTTGVVTAVAAGTAKITATSDGLSGSSAVTVTAATLSSIAVTPASPNLIAGATQQLKATGTFSDNTTQDLTSQVTWASGTASVATVSTAGLVTALTPGTSSVTATLTGKTGTSTVTVSAATVMSIAVTPASPVLAVGVTQQLTATATMSDGMTQDVTSMATWASASAATATVSATGLAKGVAAGTTSITATVGTVSGSDTIVVTTAVLKSIAVTPAAPTIAAGVTEQFVATGTYSDNSTHNVTSLVVWSSSSASATISNTGATVGLATGVSAGTATITATSGTGSSAISGSTTLTVTSATLLSIAVTPAAPVIAKGTTQQFVATGSFSDNSTSDISSQVTWASDTTTVATITSAGLASGVSGGSASISATLGTVVGSTTLTVTSANLLSISLSPVNASIPNGLTQQFTAIGTFSDTSTQDLTSAAVWASTGITDGGSPVATISNASGSVGLATAAGPGVASITATVGSVVGTTNLTVTSSTLVSIAVTPPNPTIAKGTTDQFTAIGTFSDLSTSDITSTVTWSTGTASTVASISNATGTNGLASALTQGTVTVTATLGTISGTTQLTVTSATLVSISVTPPSPSIASGQTEQFIATGTYSDSSNQDLTSVATWTAVGSTNTDGGAVATISNASGTNGLASTFAPGSSAITATVGTVSGGTTLTITAATLVSIAVTPPSPTIANGTTEQFAATGTFSDNTTQDLTGSVTWAAIDITDGGSLSTIADVSNVPGANGLATALAQGTTTVVATQGTIFGSTSLTVTAASLVSIAVSTTSPASVPLGTLVKYTAVGTYTDNSTQDISSTVTWNSDTLATATISNASGTNGQVSTVGVGTANITASLAAIVSPPVLLTVTNAVLVSIAVNTSTGNATIANGTSLQFSATGTYSDNSTLPLTTSVNWSSASPTVASISNATGSQGAAKGLSVGTSVITASVGSCPGSACITSAPVTLTVTNALLTAIAISPPAPNIAKGTNQQFTATGVYSDLSTQDITSTVTWTSATPAVASISNAVGTVGLAKGLTVGTTSISASLGSVTSAVPVILTVSGKTLSSIVVSANSLSIPNGTNVQFSATGTFSDNSTTDLTTQVTWSSASSAVASISNATGLNGLAKGLTVGTSVISASMGTVTSAGVTLAVTGATLKSIAVNPNPASAIAVGFSEQFTATGTFTDNSQSDITSTVTWNSSVPATATISNAAGTKGSAKGVASGTTLISATQGTTNSPTVSLTVNPKTLVSIAVTTQAGGPFSLANGTNLQLTATGTFSDASTSDLTSTVLWTTNPTGVAAISGTGLATGLTVGSTAVTASFGTVTSPAVTLAVTGATLTSIAITPNPASAIAVGFTEQFTAMGTFTDSSVQNITSTVTWNTSTGAATISNVSGSNGLAQGATAGSTLITATSGTITSNSVSLTVSPKSVVSVAVTTQSGGPFSLAKGTKIQLIATATFSDGTTSDISSTATWATSPTGIVQISITGTTAFAAGLAVGNTIVTASSGSGSSTVTSAGVSVAVTNATLSTIAVTPASPANLAKGFTQQFTATGTFSDGSQQNITSTVTWAASGTAATISNSAGSKGVATGAAAGTSTITATDAITGIVSPGVVLTVTGKTLVSIAVTTGTGGPFSLAKGTSLQLVATGTFSDNTTSDLSSTVSWIAGTTGVISLSLNGSSQEIASGLAVGNTNVTAKDLVSGVISPAVSVAVSSATLQSISVTPNAPASLAKGFTQQFTATGTFSDTTTQNITSTVTWAASGTAATISNSAGSKGLASGAAPGASVITATDPTTGIASTGVTLNVTAQTLVSIAVTTFSGAPFSEAKGANLRLVATGTFSDGSASDLSSTVTWATNPTGVASISINGSSQAIINGTAAGSTTVTASSGTGANIVTSPGVTFAVTSATKTSITVTPITAAISKGAEQQYTATATYSDGTTTDVTSAVTWSATGAASISNATGTNGLATGNSVGSSQITATDPPTGLVSTPVTLTVNAATLASITVTPANGTIAVGGTQQYTATGTNSDGTSAGDITSQVTWSSTSGLVTFSPTTNGLATAGSVQGQDTILAKLSGVTGTTTVNVSPAVLVGITIQASKAGPINAGQTDQFTAIATYSDGTTPDITSTVTWASDNSSAATISNLAGSYGLATGQGAGTTNISASLGAVGSNSISLTVTKKTIIGIAVTALNNVPLSLANGTTLQLVATATFTDNTMQDISSTATWASGTTAVATIVPGGVVTGVSPGTTSITATQDGVFSPGATLTVTSAVLTQVQVTANGNQFKGSSSITLPPGVTEQFTATGVFSDKTTQNLTSAVTWTTSNANISVQNGGQFSGLVTAVTTTSAPSTVIATSGTVFGSFPINVSSVTLSTITVNPSSISVPAGLNQPFTATGTFSDNSTYDLTNQVTWSSDTAADATISNAVGTKGIATTIAASDPGFVTISAQLQIAGQPSVTGNAELDVTSAQVTAIQINLVSPATTSVSNGLDALFTATGTFSDGTTSDITNSVNWNSDNTVGSMVPCPTEQILRRPNGISGSHRLFVQPTISYCYQAKTTGTTNITASISGLVNGNNGLVTSNSIAMTITSAIVESLAITSNQPSPINVPLGTTDLSYFATALLSDGTTTDFTSKVTWTVDAQNPDVTVSNAAGSYGAAVTAAVGTTTVTASFLVTDAQGDQSLVTDSVATTVSGANLVSIAVSGIPANPGSIAKGRHATVTATGTFTDGTHSDLSTHVSWESSDPTNAPMDQTVVNQVDGNGVTTTTVSCLAVYNQPVGGPQLISCGNTYTLNVTSAVVVSLSIHASPSNTTGTIAKGTKTNYTANAIFSDGTNADETASALWASSTSTVADIQQGSNGGLATGDSVGSTTISATIPDSQGSSNIISSNGISLSVSAADLVSIAVNCNRNSIPNGTTTSCSATGTYTDDSTQLLAPFWSTSSNSPATITVDQSGNVTGVAVSSGASANVVATSSGPNGTQITGSTTVTVTPAVVTSVEISTTPLPTLTTAAPAIANGTTEQFYLIANFSDGTQVDVTSAGATTWSSSVGTVAFISNVSGSNGLATSNSQGSTTISVTTSIQSQPQSASITLTVTAATLVNITVTPNPLVTNLGFAKLATATGHYTDGSTQNLTADPNLTWSSTNTNYALVNNSAGSQGVVTPVAVTPSNPAVFIVATYQGNISGQTAITVNPAILQTIKITGGSPATTNPVDPGCSCIPLFATGHYSDGSNVDLSTDPGTTFNLNVPGNGDLTLTGSSGSAWQLCDLSGGSVAAGTVTLTATNSSITGSSSPSATAQVCN